MPRPLGSQAGVADFSGHHLRLSKCDVGWFAVYFNLIREFPVGTLLSFLSHPIGILPRLEFTLSNSYVDS